MVNTWMAFSDLVAVNGRFAGAGVGAARFPGVARFTGRRWVARTRAVAGSARAAVLVVARAGAARERKSQRGDER